MPRVEGEIIIGRPVEEVFDFVADERNEPSYNPRLRHVELLTPGAIGAGTRWRAEITMARRAVPMLIQVTDFDRPWRLASSTRVSRMNIEGALLFEPVPEGTRMRWEWMLQPRGAHRLFTPLIGFMGDRQERVIWTSLKRVLEAPAGRARAAG